MKRVAIFGGAFDPPGLHHLAIVRKILTCVDEVWVTPCGIRKDKVLQTDAMTRVHLCHLTFGGIPRVRIEEGFCHQYMPSIRLLEELECQTNFQHQFWLVVGSDLIQGGKHEDSLIQRGWVEGRRLWELANFLVLSRDNYPITVSDLPPSATLVVGDLSGSSTQIRETIRQRKDISHLVTSDVARFIHHFRLYL